MHVVIADVIHNFLVSRLNYGLHQHEHVDAKKWGAGKGTPKEEKSALEKLIIYKHLACQYFQYSVIVC